MKKHLLILLVAIFAGSITAPSFAEVKYKKAKTATPATEEYTSTGVKKLSDEEINCLVNRLNEIRDMDKKDLSKADKKALKHEVKDIKDILKEQDYVLYVSLTVVLIVLLLILIL